jgi:predicted Ser/Thr protein kinase
LASVYQFHLNKLVLLIFFFFFLHQSDFLSIKIKKNAILGKGPYGTVFEGEWNGKKVAVKRIEKTKCENNKEDEALQKLDHPNVVKLYHVESDSDFR